jgi:predicted restriction endonuclease
LKRVREAMSRYINLYDEATLLRVVSAYLFNNMSHRGIQRDILNLPAPARGGGFVAMDILHYFGIHGDKKGILLQRSIVDELAAAQGKYKEALVMVSEYKHIEDETKELLRLGQNTFELRDEPTEVSVLTKNRIRQSALRDYVLCNYSYRCALCDINKSDLLVCSHIKPWATDENNRLNPSNAICFCVLHDKLFDRGYFSLSNSYDIVFSRKADEHIKELLSTVKFKRPRRNIPGLDFLRYHREVVCK